MLSSQELAEGGREIGSRDVKKVIPSVCEKLGVADCKSLVRCLSVEEAHINDIAHDHQGNASEQKYQMLLKWMKIKGKDATIEKLYHALVESGHKDIADNLEQDTQFGNRTVSSNPSGGTTSNGSSRVPIARVVGQQRSPRHTVFELRQPSELFTGENHVNILKGIVEKYEDHCQKYPDPNNRYAFVQVLHGLGGCGKTEIVTQYVWKNWQQYISGVYTLSGTSNSHLDLGLKRLLKRNNAVQNGDDLTSYNIRRLAQEWLLNNSNWLLVIDDVDDPAVIKYVFPNDPVLLDGHILITTRDSDGWDGWYNVVKTEVQSMSQYDSAIYLLRETGAASVSNAAQQLNTLKTDNPQEYEAVMWLGSENALHGLPLALHQASAYIKACHQTFAQYKTIYSDSNTDVLKYTLTDPLEGWLKVHNLDAIFAPVLRKYLKGNLFQMKDLKHNDLQESPILMNDHEIDTFRKACQVTDHEELGKMADPSKGHVLTTWKVNYEKICQDEVMSDFLHLCCCLATVITVKVLVDGIQFLPDGVLKGFVQERHEDGTKMQIRILELFQKLMKFSFATSFIQRSRDEFQQPQNVAIEKFSIHHMVQVVSFKLADRESRVRSLNNAMHMLEKLFPKLDDVHSDSLDVLYKEEVRESNLQLAFHTVALARQIGLLEDNLEGLDNTTELFTVVGLYLRRLGFPGEAKTLYKTMARLIRFKKPYLEEDYVEGMRHLGNVNFELKLYDEAMQCFKISQDLAIKCYGENHRAVAMAMQCQARIWQIDEEYMGNKSKQKELVELLKDAWEKKKIYYKDKKDEGKFYIAHVILQLGCVYQETQDYETAEDLLKESCDIMKEYWMTKYGYIESVDVALAMTKLARGYILRNQDGGQMDDAEQLLIEALEMKRGRMIPASDPYQLGLYYLAALYRDKGDEKKSMEYYEKLVDKGYITRFNDTVNERDKRKVYPLEVTIWV